MKYRKRKIAVNFTSTLQEWNKGKFSEDDYITVVDTGRDRGVRVQC